MLNCMATEDKPFIIAAIHKEPAITAIIHRDSITAGAWNFKLASFLHLKCDAEFRFDLNQQLTYLLNT